VCGLRGSVGRQYIIGDLALSDHVLSYIAVILSSTIECLVHYLVYLGMLTTQDGERRIDSKKQKLHVIAIYRLIIRIGIITEHLPCQE